MRGKGVCNEVAVEDDGWSEWLHPCAPSFFAECCDCGLIHEMEFEIVPSADNARLNPGEGDDGVIIFRVRRSDAASAIEARRPATAQTDAVHESAVPERQTPNDPGASQEAAK